MEKKDIIIGISLIAIVAIGGTIGLFFILNQPSTEEGGIPNEGLPTNWNTAPNSSYFILKNHTAEIKVTLGDILEGVRLAIEEENTPVRINEYKDVIYYHEFIYQGYRVAGVDFLNILEKFDTHFAFNLSFVSKSSEKIYITTEKIIDKMYEGSEDPIVLIIAANGKWLADSPLGSSYGNFSIIGENWNKELLNLESIEALDNWTIPINVNGQLNYTITPSNVHKNEYVGNYSYDRSDYWNYDRQYWGRNISDIIQETSAAGKNYTLRFYAADGVFSPYDGYYYDQDDVEKGIEPPFRPTDLINGSKALPDTDKLMCLIYKQQEFGESYGGTADPIWSHPKMLGYGSGPFSLVVPGRPRGEYIKYINRIEISITSE
ncbi:MAG: hypothetical protein EU547_02930 [Promethearchaeota archaeon]|nr:MAG: hypothetical protein EU547_02930 [Candidatus Lokiarchaeota archaeon]